MCSKQRPPVALLSTVFGAPSTSVHSRPRSRTSNDTGCYAGVTSCRLSPAKSCCSSSFQEE
ncbi:hypothetical protein V5799_002707, partial [Amblyomma americanum]